MSYLVDTNIISEVRKGPRCDVNVARWYAALTDDDLYLSVLVLGEIRRGIELSRTRHPDRVHPLEHWLRAAVIVNPFDSPDPSRSVAVGR